ncbi:MAG: sigma-54-dependent Fis family transcriptional regulator [Calditrichaeota bacterium]|nr:MAG: sigma-54-dependent Fis family transcriptional regulator [Calditrichota bacterium]
MIRILIAEDDRNTLTGLVEILCQEGFDAIGAESGEEALQILSRHQFDILLTDLRMPDMTGMELFEKAQLHSRQMKTIIMTAYNSVKDAVEAMKSGVYEYLTKPLDLDELFIILKKAVSDFELERENEELKQRLQGAYRFENIIGSSKVMQDVFRTIVKVARSESTILIRGESGTGKELVARAIHYNSPRAKNSLIEVSCASFPETLLESELFGYEKGAFTGAAGRKIGRFELADKGTIFLDEIGEISSSVQTKLLRVLQEREISRLGGTSSISVDTRVIAATNRDLEEALTNGRFREDLYYRLNVIPVSLPPLRARKEDIPLLVDHFIRKYAKVNKRGPLTIHEDVLNICLEYHWPGNVRELENAMENAVVLGEGDKVLPEHLPVFVKIRKAKRPDGLDVILNAGETFREKIEFAERLILEEAIKKAAGNKSEAAKQLEISLRNMRYKISKYNL